MCPQEKGRQINAIRSRVVHSLQSALRAKYYQIRAFLAYFAAKGRAFSLQSRLAGGAGSLALTFLCPNSLLTGNLTGNFGNFSASETALLVSKPNISEGKHVSRRNASREFSERYQGFRFSYQGICREAFCEDRTPEPEFIEPETFGGRLNLDGRIPTVPAARPSSREGSDTICQSSSPEAVDLRGSLRRYPAPRRHSEKPYQRTALSIRRRGTVISYRMLFLEPPFHTSPELALMP
jgi:hypothetical protein